MTDPCGYFIDLSFSRKYSILDTCMACHHLILFLNQILVRLIYNDSLAWEYDSFHSISWLSISEYLGCYVENSSGTRILPIGGGTGGMTNPKCVASCKDKGALYAGTQFAQECYCGSSVKYIIKGAAPLCNLSAWEPRYGEFTWGWRRPDWYHPAPTKGNLGSASGPIFPSPRATVLALCLDCSTRTLPTAKMVLSNSTNLAQDLCHQ